MPEILKASLLDRLLIAPFLIAFLLLLALAGCGVRGTASPSSNPSPTGVATILSGGSTPQVAGSPAPAPSATPRSTVSTAPTATPAGAARATDTPAPAAKYQTAPVFEKAMREYQGGLQGAVRNNYPGAAVEAARETRFAEQSFGSYGTTACSSPETLFLWREDTRQIYFLLVRSTGLQMDICRNFWSAFADNWRSGDSNNEDLKAPAGSVVPTAGFGKVWRENFYGKSPLGLDFPKAPERYLAGTVQRFENATAFYFPDTKAVYVLFHNFSYFTRSGDRTGQVWFRVD